MVHAPSSDAAAHHAAAAAGAQPDEGRAVVRVHLEAREAEWEFARGRTTTAWTFNGQVPGPVIEARVGDVLEVHLMNNLREPTTIHWHGLRLPAAMDGTDMVQHPVEPGAMFAYRFKLLDAGTFWYHSHTNETVQLEHGLYGAIVVRSDDEPVFDRERVLVFDDVDLDASGEVTAPHSGQEQHDGREGDTRLINGVEEPELMIWAGQVERWRIVNAASARYLRLSIGGRPFGIIATSGGLLEGPLEVTEVLLTPGERVDVAVGPFETGDEMWIDSLPYDRGTGRKLRERFGTLRAGPAAPSIARVPRRLRTIDQLAAADALPTRTITFGSRPNHDGGVDFLINGEQHHRAEAVVVGTLQVWDVVNATTVDHPFHLHGFFFQVLSRDGASPAFRSWEDTTNVPAGGRIRIAWTPDDRPGEWMYHCHILEHHGAGMMAHFTVVRG